MAQNKLVLGPVLFNWDKNKLMQFYDMIAAEPAIDAVCVGEVICAKREKFSHDYWLDIIDGLLESGKQVRFSTLSVVSNDYESKVNREICNSKLLNGEANLMVEVNDVTTLACVNNSPFSVGQLFNCYNEATVQFLSRKGATSITLPVELAQQAICSLSLSSDVDLGVQVFGRMPLALSVRCYQARAYGLNKQNCEIICKNDLDGLAVNTLENTPIFSVNGLQTLSYSYCNLIEEIDILKQSGVSEFRISPQDISSMGEVCRLFKARLEDNIASAEAKHNLVTLLPSVTFSNGYCHQKPGKDLINIQNIA